jgi:hypothetical protein
MRSSACVRVSGPIGRTRLESRQAGPIGRDGLVPPNTRSPTCVEGGSASSSETAASCAALIFGVPAPSSAAMEPEASKASRILGVPAGVPGVPCAPAGAASAPTQPIAATRTAARRSFPPPPSIVSN